jgi:hypothetical protein
LRKALLGTWRLIDSSHIDADGTRVKAFGDNPQGYLIYTADNHVVVQMATRAERGWPGPEVLDMSRGQAITALGFMAYCGTFGVSDGQVIHYREFGVFPNLTGNVEPRSVVLDGDRLTLRTPGGAQLEWQRVR